MPVLSVGIIDFLVRNIFMEEVFSGNLSIGTDLAINFDLIKYITKNKYTLTIMKRWKESFHQKGKIYQQDAFSYCVQGRLSFLLSFSLKFIQYMHQPARPLYNILMSGLKFLYR